MIIYIDMDNVIAECNARWLEIISREYGFDIVKEDMREYNFDNVIPDAYMKHVFQIPRRRRFLLGLDPIPGAQEAVLELSRDHELYFVTTPLMDSLYAHWEKARWLMLYFGIGEEYIIFTHHKHLLRGDVLIDDKLENLEKFKGYRIVFDQPWNRCFNGLKPFSARRCVTWEGVLKIINTLE